MRGQSAVETALILPLTLFSILGVIQLSLMMHARYAAQHAAFSAARSASVHNGNCKSAVTAALLAVAPMVGRTKDAASFLKVWSTPGGQNFTVKGRPSLVANRYPGIANIPIVELRMSDWFVGQSRRDPPFNLGDDSDFDVLDQPIMITYEATFNFELRIPFANAVVHESWAGANYFGGINSLMTARERANIPQLPARWMKYYIAARQDKRYIIPIPATATTRMMSNPYRTYWGAAKNPCTDPNLSL